jgi:hypothetical protein
MSVRLDGAAIRLEGECRVEEAEPLLALLLEDRGREVDLGGAGPLHTAVVQVLLALGPRVRGVPEDGFITHWLLPVLAAKPGGGQ